MEALLHYVYICHICQQLCLLCRLGLLLCLAALLVQCYGNLHHLTPTHTRAKLSHGQCIPPNNLFSKMGKVSVAGDRNLKDSASECATACG